MLFNYHTHTKRCHHASGEDREYVEAAIAAGVKTLGFSDHAPYIFPNGYRSGHRIEPEELFAYVESVRALAKEYEKDVCILCGFELEYYPAHHQEAMALLRQVNPDYLILGQHALNNEYDGFPVHNHPQEEVVSAYVAQTIEGLATGDFTYLAHPDIVGWVENSEKAKREYRRLCEFAKENNIPLEINLLGVRRNRCYPARPFWELAGEVGASVVIGVDAHEPQAFLQKNAEEKALQLVKELGLKLIEEPFL